MELTYLAPAASRIPASISMAGDYVDAARDYIYEPCYEYIDGGSGMGMTAASNLRAFEELRVYPRVLRDIRSGNTKVDVPGASLAHPVLLAPVAYQTLVHPVGERETARGARVTGACMVASTFGTCTLEDIAGASVDGPRWFQLYLQPDPVVTADLIRRAERAGYTAIVVTLDATVQVPNQRALRLGFKIPRQVAPANLQNYPVSRPPVGGASDHRILEAAAANAVTWDDLDRLRSLTSLPIWVKGVLHPEDAAEIKQAGFAGVVVSNHGGRGLDGAPASLHALPEIRRAVGEGYPLLVDGGVRSGLDVFKALARGADAVLIGRLQMYALAVAGALGVAHMVRLLREELEVCMALAGCRDLAAIRTAKVE